LAFCFFAYMIKNRTVEQNINKKIIC